MRDHQRPCHAQHQARVMEEENLTFEQCDELTEALREDAACLPHGSERDFLLRLAEGYRLLADMKRRLVRKIN